MGKERRVAVTGIGAVTSIGSSVPEFWRSLLDGRCGIGPVSLFDASAYRTQTAAEVREIPDGFLTAGEKRRMSRADRMGIAAAAVLGHRKSGRNLAHSNGSEAMAVPGTADEA